MLKRFINIFKSSPFGEWISYLHMKSQNRVKNPSVKFGYMSKVNNCQFGKNIRIYENTILSDLSVGDYSYIARDCIIGNASIGKFCSIGPSVKCGLGKHPVEKFVSTHPIFYSTRKQVPICFADKQYFIENEFIEIGNDVWIGANSIIMDGVKISDGAIIASGSVVNKNVPPYAVVGGIPAKIIKFRFDDDEIDFLLKSKWWNYNDDVLRNSWKQWHDLSSFKIFVKSLMDNCE